MSQSDTMEFADEEERHEEPQELTMATFTKYMETNVTNRFGPLENKVENVVDKLSMLNERVSSNGGRLLSLEHRVKQIENGGQGVDHFPALQHLSLIHI